jgi:hypothetical protein
MSRAELRRTPQALHLPQGGLNPPDFFTNVTRASKLPLEYEIYAV